MIDRLPDIGIRPTLPAALASAVATYGDADYVVTPATRMSFREADARSKALAKRMLAAGVGKGTRVGVVLPSSEAFAVVFLAAARVGAIATLFSTTYRPAELRRAMRIADVQLLVAPRTLLGNDYEAHLEETVDGLADATAPYRLPSMPFLREVWLIGDSDRPWATPITVDGTDLDGSDVNDHGISDELLAAVEDEVTPADPLLVIWTSGSSADPKGVIHTHGVCVRKVSPTVGLGLQASREPGGRVLMAMPFFWVGGPQSLIGCLLTGSCLVAQERFEAGGALELIEREGCTSIGGWPTTIDTLRAHPDWDRRDVSTLPPPDMLRPATPISSKGDGINMGMTETFGPHFNPTLFDYKVVEHDTGALLPDGEEGEFCVRGFGLMAGMYKKEREEILDADGYYHTGDRGYLENGTIFFKGRYSEMIKSGGANVAPLEVEATLLAFPEIRHAFVFGVPHPSRGEEVVAVLVAEDGMTIDAADIRQRTNKLLSSYKVPSRIEVLDVTEVPWLASGKPDKRSMRAAVEAKL